MKAHTRIPLDPGRGYEIRGGSFERRVLTIGSGDTVDSISGGATFRDCEIRVLSATRQSLNFDATFIDCDIRFSKPLSNRQLTRPRFINCRFTGQFSGCEFGPKFQDSLGRVENCDFTGARLAVTEFFDCGSASLRWPDWPHIYLLYGEDLSWTKELSDEALPRKLISLLRLPRHESVTPRSILAIHLPSEDCDVESVWALVQDIPEVWFPSKSQRTRADPGLVEQALAANRKALALATRSRERTTLLGNLHRSWLKSARRVSEGDVELVFDCSHLKQRVPSAPERIHVRLHSGAAHHRLESTTHEINGELDRFMVMGVGEEGNDVVLKPHRKERGQVVLSFESYSVLDEQHQLISEEVLLNAVSQYYGQNAP